MIQYKAYDNFCNKLGNEDGENDVYQIVKVEKKKCKDLGIIRCIKDIDQRIMINNNEIKERLKIIFNNYLINSSYRI